MSEQLDQTQGTPADPSPAASPNGSPFTPETPVTLDEALRDTRPAETPAPSPAPSEDAEDATPAYGEQDASDPSEDNEESYDEDEDDSYDDEDDDYDGDTYDDDAPEDTAARNAAFRDLRVRAEEAETLRQQLEAMYADPLLQEAWSHGYHTVSEFAQAVQAHRGQQAQAEYLQQSLDNGRLTAGQVQQIVQQQVQQQVAPLEQDRQVQATRQAYQAAVADVPQLATDPDFAALLQKTPAEHIPTVARAVSKALAQAEQNGYDRAVRARSSSSQSAPTPTGTDGYAPPDVDAPEKVWSIGEALRSTSRRLTH